MTMYPDGSGKENGNSPTNSSLEFYSSVIVFMGVIISEGFSSEGFMGAIISNSYMKRLILIFLLNLEYDF